MHKHYRSGFSKLFSIVLESIVELDGPKLEEAGVSVYTDSSNSSEEVDERAEPRPAVKLWVGFGCCCTSMAVRGACRFPC